MKKIIFLFSLAALSACKDSSEQIPAYLSLKPFTVNATGGASWQKITDGWLYVDGVFLGAYTLPDTIPVLADGNSEIILFPGVKENGIAGTPNIYPYMNRYTVTKNLTGPQITEILPVTDYVDKLVYAFGETRGDFDGGSSISLENRDSDGAVNAELTTDGAFFGKSVKMQVDTTHPIMDVATEAMTGLPALGAPEVWLELNYKCDMPFFLYLLSGSSEKAVFVYLFNPSESWNKTYLNLTSNIVETQQSEQRLYFRLGLPRDSNGKFTINNGTVMLDNIRVVHL